AKRDQGRIQGDLDRPGRRHFRDHPRGPFLQLAMMTNKRTNEKAKAPAGAAARGFTLIELLVAVSLFAIAVAIAAGGFVRALRTQRQLIALISANSSASLAIEQMAREMRTGFGFGCTAVAGVCDQISFTNASGEEVRYYSEDGVLKRGTGTSTAQPLTPA